MPVLLYGLLCVVSSKRRLVPLSCDACVCCEADCDCDCDVTDESRGQKRVRCVFLSAVPKENKNPTLRMWGKRQGREKVAKRSRNGYRAGYFLDHFGSHFR